MHDLSSSVRASQAKTCVGRAIRRGPLPFASCAVTVLLAAGGAFATSTHWFSGGLGAYESSTAGFQGPNAHPIYYIEGDTDHNNFCVQTRQRARLLPQPPALDRNRRRSGVCR